MKKGEEADKDDKEELTNEKENEKD